MKESEFDCEIVGMSFLIGGGCEWLPLRRGLNVFYGLNGAGKSTVLKELADFFSGSSEVDSRSRVYLRFPRAAERLRNASQESRDDETEKLIKTVKDFFGPPDSLEEVASSLGDNVKYPALRSGYFYVQQSGRGIAGFTIGYALPIDGSSVRLPKEYVPSRSEFTPRHLDVPATSRERADFPTKEWTEWLSRLHRSEETKPTDVDFDALKKAEALATYARDQIVDEEGDEDKRWEVPLLRHCETNAGFVPICPFLINGLINDGRFADVFDVDGALQQKLVESTGKHLGRITGAATAADLPEDAVQSLAKAAQTVYDGMLIDAPRLRLSRPVGAETFTQAPFRWQASEQDDAAAPAYDLGTLSSAQHRWAAFSIAESVSETIRNSWHPRPDEVLRIVVVDEPEAGLHRVAEAQMAEGLAGYATQTGAYVIAASHSPMLLDDPRAHIVEVTRLPAKKAPGQGDPQARPSVRLSVLDAPAKESMKRLGLHPSDLLRRIRYFVLVEGEHDKIVLQTLFGDQLRKARAEVFPVRGGTNLKDGVDSRFISDFTDATLLAVLDGMRTRPGKEAWRRAKKVFASQGHDAAIEDLKQSLPSKKKSDPVENNFLRNYYSRALETGQESRVDFRGLSKPDIIMYLNCATFVPDATWDSLRTRYKEQSKATNFKSWLLQKYKIKIDNELVLKATLATQALGSIDPELTSIIDALDPHPTGGVDNPQHTA